jgi:hypothetical protein
MRLVALLFAVALVAACNSRPIVSRTEVISSPPTQSFLVNQSYEQIASDWDNGVRDIFSMCLVDFRPSTSLVKVPNENIFEVRTRNQFGPYYGLIQLIKVSSDKTRIKIYDFGALPCFTEKIVPFFLRYKSG